MGKKRAIVISSSSSSDDDQPPTSGRGRRKSDGSSESRRRGLSRGPKRDSPVRKSRRGSRSIGGRSGIAEEVNFDNLTEEFYECLHGPSFLSGFRKMGAEELWVEKHKPSSLVDLAVNKKKVEQIRKWLEERLTTSYDFVGNNVLLITGQSGIGKSATVHVVVNELGAELCEWTTPTPTLWQEHLHNSYSGIRYMSKLDEFELFVEQVSKYRLLPLTTELVNKNPVVILIDDLPVTNGRVAYERLRRYLDLLIHSVQVPTLILITEFPKDDASDNVQRHGEGLDLFLEKIGAFKISFNPITVNSIKKTLLKICQAEKCVVSEEWISSIAKTSGGDIRYAITSLQYFCLAPTQSSLPQSTVASTRTNSGLSPLAIHMDSGPDCNFSLPFGRDETLSFFHALGKFLHNKREAEHGIDGSAFPLKEQYARCQSKLDDPEKALGQAHAQARSIIDFLHENVLDFVNDEAIHDAWTVSSYLSDSDCLLMASRTTFPRVITWRYEPDHLSQLVAASVAVRGVLFGNSQPSSSRWHSMRTPRLWQMDRSLRNNKNNLVMDKFHAYGSTSSTSISEIACEYRPAVRYLGSRSLADAHPNSELPLDQMLEDNNLQPDMSDPVGTCYTEASDDEIEEW